MQLAGVGHYLRDMVLAADGLPKSDVVLNVVFTVATFIIGWVVSLGGSNTRLRTRVINELLMAQSELRARAWPSTWRMNDTREAWMLDPFVARIRFLYASVSEDKTLTRRQLDLIEHYIARVQDFIETWEVTQVRRERYRQSYNQTYHAMRAAARALGCKDASRFSGLGLPDSSLFGDGTPALQPAPRPGIAPAE